MQWDITIKLCSALLSKEFYSNIRDTVFQMIRVLICGYDFSRHINLRATK